MPYRIRRLPARPPVPGRRAAGGPLAVAVASLLAAGALAPAPAAAAPSPPGAASGFPASVRATGQARVTAAVLDLDGAGRTPVVYGDDAPYDTASIVKVDILAALLLRAQDAGRGLSAQERSQAEAMIEHSDNAAANTLWRRIGLAPGLAAANERLGLLSTTGGPGAKWGLTRTTASDQIRLLGAVFGTDRAGAAGAASALDGASRTRVRTLMGRVAADQSWGVSAAGSEWALKNGWLRRSTTGRWDVNSVGRITGNDGHHYLVAVLSDGSTSMTDGVALVERAARTAVASSAAA
ncbi:serine hydrolase [Streptomyces sp. TG1A-8]|uniref:serine hydrolase n=1 Tax=Streptomyces sp. TG1A-8 TaxID=3051385 RepID=UPI00265BCE06|nr:serine hydrolase [Streptomyces sp. TG1A-8]MDO0929301.1 serine hydrolase [Streptomyces sp. TG1A-8]